MTTVRGNGQREKVVLAYSGGLDTSVAIRWLQETKALDVVTLTLDLGQEGADLEAAASKARQIGAAAARTLDVKDEFVQDYIRPAIWANALYGGKYPLATALGRPLIGKKLAEIALEEGAHAIAHGCTGKGNDQVRIEVSANAFHPQLHTIAPMREWVYTRDDAVQYAEAHGIPVPVKVGKAFSIDENLWGRSIESGPIEDAAREPPEEAFAWTVSPEDAPSAGETVEIRFEAGVPVALNGVAKSLLQIVLELNDLAGDHGVGRIDQIEDRLVGIKSREIYEAPAATVLIAAHRELEALTLGKDVLQFKPLLEAKFAELTYNGLWFTPLMDALQAFLAKTQERVTGTVRLRLYKGHFEDHLAFDRYRHDRDWRAKRHLTEATFGWAITAHKAMQARERLAAAELWQDHDLVFCTSNGTPLDRHNVLRDLRRIIGKPGLNENEWTARRDMLFDVVRTTTAIQDPKLERPVSGEDLIAFQRLVRKVPVAEPVMRHALDIVRASRPKSDTCPDSVRKWVAFGASVRAAQYLVLGGKARALTSGRYHVSFEDIRALAHPVMRHRIITNFHAQSEGITTDMLTDRLLEAVPLPRSGM